MTLLFFLFKLIHSNGYYNYFIGDEMIPLYTIILNENEKWIRLNYKEGTNFYPTNNQKLLTQKQVSLIFPYIKDFAWSNNITTLNVSQSWIIRNVNITTSSNNSNDLIIYLTNLINNKTPTGTNWVSTYSSGYVFFTGFFTTFGSWNTMYIGCGSLLTTPINVNFTFRSGGGISHTGEYIHSSCNGYSETGNSITSLVSWSNTRSFWIKIYNLKSFSTKKSKKITIKIFYLLIILFN